jgi:hypothetical protein
MKKPGFPGFFYVLRYPIGQHTIESNQYVQIDGIQLEKK